MPVAALTSRTLKKKRVRDPAVPAALGHGSFPHDRFPTARPVQCSAPQLGPTHRPFSHDQSATLLRPPLLNPRSKRLILDPEILRELRAAHPATIKLVQDRLPLGSRRPHPPLPVLLQDLQCRICRSCLSPRLRHLRNAR